MPTEVPVPLDIDHVTSPAQTLNDLLTPLATSQQRTRKESSFQAVSYQDGLQRLYLQK